MSERKKDCKDFIFKLFIMRKYTKKELSEIFDEIKKYTIAWIILKRFTWINSFQLQIVKEAESLKKLPTILNTLSEIEKNILKMNISAKASKFLKDFEKLWIKEKQEFLKEYSLPVLWTSIVEDLLLE